MPCQLIRYPSEPEPAPSDAAFVLPRSTSFAPAFHCWAVVDSKSHACTSVSGVDTEPAILCASVCLFEVRSPILGATASPLIKSAPSNAAVNIPISRLDERHCQLIDSLSGGVLYASCAVASRWAFRTAALPEPSVIRTVLRSSVHLRATMIVARTMNSRTDIERTSYRPLTDRSVSTSGHFVAIARPELYDIIPMSFVFSISWMFVSTPNASRSSVSVRLTVFTLTCSRNAICSSDSPSARPKRIAVIVGGFSD